MVESSDPHADLGVRPDATQPEIREAFRRRLRQHHPDTRRSAGPADDDQSDAALQRILAAYAALRGAQPPQQDRHTVPPAGPKVSASGTRPNTRGLEASRVFWRPADDTDAGGLDRPELRVGTSLPLLTEELLRWLLRRRG
jgi:DnaJ domain